MVSAIANAMAICNEQSPEIVHYDTKMMRQHLAGCLEDQVFHHFPARERFLKVEVLKVYCTCHLPEGGERMIACDNW